MPALLMIFIQAAISYVFSRMTQPDGPRLKDLEASGGEYGVSMPRAFGDAVRSPGIFIAMDDIKETKHKVKDGSALFGLVGLLLPNPKYYTYSVTLAQMLLDRLGDDPIEGVDMAWANGKLIFNVAESAVVSESYGSDGKLIRRKYGKNKYFKSLTLYAGHDEQGVDPVLAATVSEDGSYPFIAYVVIEDLQLADFGNGPPTIDYLVRVKAGQTLAEFAEVVCATGGIVHDRNMSSTALTAHHLRGYVINGQSTCWDAIKPLLPVFGVDAAEVGGQIRFYRRSQSMRSTISLDAMGGHAFGDEPPEKIRFKRNFDQGLPKATSINFIDPARDYGKNTATAERSEGDAKSNIEVTLPVVMTPDEAASAAALMHWDAWLGRTEAKFTLTDRWLPLAAGLAYGVPTGNDIVPYRITMRRRGDNGLIEVEAVSDEAVTYSARVEGSSGAPPDRPTTLLPDTTMVLMDMPILSDEHDDYGFYIVLGDGGPDWQWATIEASSDGITYSPLGASDDSAVTGEISGIVPAGPTDGLDDTLDEATVVTVVLAHDGLSLDPATDGELDTGANLCFIGLGGAGEYLQFKTVSKIAPRIWELSGLRRGRRGTDHAIGGHGANEQFALLTGDGIFRAMTSLAQWGDAYQLRAVSLNQDADDAEVYPFANSGEGKRPFSPIELTDSWDVDFNLSATFVHRARMIAGGLGIDDNFEFEIQITNASPVRTIVVTTEAFDYSAVDQEADGLFAGATVIGRVRQTSDVNDGRWRTFTFHGPRAFTADTTMIRADDTTLTADMT